jgi:hypothetical protein
MAHGQGRLAAAWVVALVVAAVGCGGSHGSGGTGDGGGGSGGGGGGGGGSNGNAAGHCDVPAAGQAVDTSHATTVVGDGTAASCTAASVVAAVHGGGVVTFSCGADPLTIVVPELDIFNDGGLGDGSVTLDGGGLITLSGGGANRILYQNTCDQALHYTTTHCQAQDTPQLVLQHIAFAAGHGDADQPRGLLGGGAIYVGGGTLTAVDIRVTGSTQATLGQDNAGGAIYSVNQAAPAFVVGSTFDGNAGSNGGALGSIGTSWTILNSVLSNNRADGNGENPARAGTPGGGLGGAIYNDGNDYTLTVCGSALADNQANELGSGAIFEVVDNLAGKLTIDQSTFSGNSNNGSVQSHAGIYVEAGDKQGNAGVTITNSTFN